MVSVTYDPDAVNPLSGNTKSFLRIITDNKIKVYKYVHFNTNEIYILAKNKNGALDIVALKAKTASSINIQNSDLKWSCDKFLNSEDKIIAFFHDCPSLKEKFKSGILSPKDILPVIKYYNLYCN